MGGVDGLGVVVEGVEVLDSSNVEEKILKPSLKGSENVLGSIRRSESVKRLVHISSVAAVRDSSSSPEDHRRPTR